IADGTGPITIPLAFIPLTVDGTRLGTFRRVTIYRDSLQRPTRIEASISGTDSAGLARLAECVIAIDASNPEKIEPHRYTCLDPADTAGADLVDFGDLDIRDHDAEFLLYAPRAQVEELRNGFGSNATVSDSLAEDSVETERERIRAVADSMEGAADSIHRAEMERIDSIRRAAMPG
ncbi:MAG TPA: hypothetical protein VK012_03905, partial [Gemmatimonadales bacterium]|nr:hypothetical protein [Gemmatimonadales bacterium]